MELSASTILVTGGTGSFGNRVAAQLARFGPKQLRIYSRDEKKQWEMQRSFPNFRYIIGDVRDPSRLADAMRGVDFVFHAAALKQVPSCDFFPMQAVYTNVNGSHHVVDSAIRNGVEKVICLSTDKAVYPINAMGMTKALMEKVAQAAARATGNGRTVVSVVRYGNVMYSRGSVIPLFVQQIKERKPLTITEPSMTRFLLPLHEAVDLVLFAFAQGRQGDILIRKAPACTLADLATALKTVFRSEVPVKVIGVRHGEKLYETLATREELRRADDMRDYYRVVMDSRDLNYSKYFTEGDVHEAEVDDYTSHNTTRLSVKEVETLLRTLPEIQQALATE